MKSTITPNEARLLLDKYIKAPAMHAHSLGTQVAMRKIAEALNENVELWGIVGLLHDLDMESIDNNLSKHGIRTVELLREEGYDTSELFVPILAHTEVLKSSPYRRESLLDYSLSGVENLEGFLAAYVFVRPSRSIAGADPKSIVKKMKDKSFANNVNRDAIFTAIEQSGIERSEYIQLVIDALSEIASEIGM